ncbi:excalibur calcium-binding domain-containing protein [Porphyrobacter sp. YT40]|uniref:excalibur calcium-binding domain-containing protein n=1 Tax=Porphyrobacter sp. YT40 TaxID=2547601 RepID=UPI0011436736|nr:excalibur calcium-binding domain-containing protein [Porphyrobacter sp. YT40]QDH32959.1 excalibur calcium-binding domain-containing protein [Porphyrobacter sp. YT40]
MGSLLAGACLQMKDRDDEDEGLSMALKIEAAVLLIAWVLGLFFAIASLLGPIEANAHPGGLAADGCHNDRKNGGRHCHRQPSASTAKTSSGSGKIHYPNCAAARAAGAAPIYRGQPGYGSHLDRDGDGKACE